MDITTKIATSPPVSEAVPHQCVTGEILSSLPYFTLLTDSYGKVIFANEAVSEIFQHDRSLIPQKNIGSIITPVHADKQTIEILAALENSGRWSGELLVVRPDGTQALLNMVVVKIPASRTDAAKILYSGHDVTSQRCQERETCLAGKYSTRGEMAGEISHELNNYLSIIMGNLELLGMGIAKGNIDSLAPRIKSMRDGLTRVAKFVEGLMSIARPESSYETLDLRQLVEDEVFYIRHNPRYKEIEFIYEWDENVPQIDAVRSRLQQGLVNIFDNACDALEAVPVGQKKITIKASYLVSDDRVQLSISDNGCGISEEDYPKLFRQLFTTKGHGHGFGLLTLKGSIKSQGGKISAAPVPEGGTCFTIEMPRKNGSLRGIAGGAPA
jgi:PAS domain S-box-containing protein